MHIIYDTVGFIKTLAFVDVIFFLAVLGLMLLVITLIYFIKENNDDEFNKAEENAAPTIEGIDEEILNLKEIKDALESASEPDVVNLSRYEEEQEEKAIISYEELLKRKQDFAINYTDEEEIEDDLTVRKVDLDNLLNKDVVEPSNINVTVISYKKEEAFLEALKNLQHMLN